MEKIIYTKWIAQELVKHGFRIKRIQQNLKDPTLLCWVFEESDAFKKAFTEITQN